MAADVQKMGVLKLLGAKGEGGTVADIIGRGDVSGDADKVFSAVGGVGVAGAGAGGVWGAAFLATGALAQPGDTGAGGDFRKAPVLSVQETLTQSREYMSKMRDTQRRVASLQDQARKQQDVIKLNCVDDKLVRVRGHLAVADQSMAALNTAVTRADDGARQHEFTRLSILHQKVLVLGTEAEGCIGEDVSYVGATKVDIEVDPAVPEEDPTQPLLPLPDVSRPPEASPFA
jgi:hypothetical protein